MAVLYLKTESLTWKAGTYMDTKAYIKIFLKYWILRSRHQISPAWNANCFRNNVLFWWIYSIALHTNERTCLGMFVYTLIHTEATTEATEPRITSWHATPIEAVTYFVYVHTDTYFGAVRTPGTSRTFWIRRMQMGVFVLSIANRTMWSCAIFLLNTVWRKYLITQNFPEAQKLRVTVYDKTLWTPHLNHGRK